MDDSSIEGRVEMLRREIAMIQRAELNYRGHRNHSLEDKAEHDKREFRILAIREELRKLRDQGARPATPC
jgi:hypothetical protein